MHINVKTLLIKWKDERLTWPQQIPNSEDNNMKYKSENNKTTA